MSHYYSQPLYPNEAAVQPQGPYFPNMHPQQQQPQYSQQFQPQMNQNGIPSPYSQIPPQNVPYPHPGYAPSGAQPPLGVPQPSSRYNVQGYGPSQPPMPQQRAPQPSPSQPPAATQLHQEVDLLDLNDDDTDSTHNSVSSSLSSQPFPFSMAPQVRQQETMQPKEQNPQQSQHPPQPQSYPPSNQQQQQPPPQSQAYLPSNQQQQQSYPPSNQQPQHPPPQSQSYPPSHQQQQHPSSQFPPLPAHMNPQTAFSSSLPSQGHPLPHPAPQQPRYAPAAPASAPKAGYAPPATNFDQIRINQSAQGYSAPSMSAYHGQYQPVGYAGGAPVDELYTPGTEQGHSGSNASPPPPPAEAAPFDDLAPRPDYYNRAYHATPQPQAPPFEDEYYEEPKPPRAVKPKHEPPQAPRREVFVPHHIPYADGSVELEEEEEEESGYGPPPPAARSPPRLASPPPVVPELHPDLTRMTEKDLEKLYDLTADISLIAKIEVELGQRKRKKELEQQVHSEISRQSVGYSPSGRVLQGWLDGGADPEVHRHCAARGRRQGAGAAGKAGRVSEGRPAILALAYLRAASLCRCSPSRWPGAAQRQLAECV
eukprot:GCRY01004694.1.p1 GENE.GCRY01004694.1~~GCRY01004694.1.p1  ORF type:complete len:593 (+),score=88.04 GCRY01004694.1:146-1924(+)